MRMVGRVLAARNARLGRPLGEKDLEDLAQDVLVIVWRKLSQYAGQAPLDAWVYRICVYELLNAMRRSGKKIRMVPFDESTPEPVAPPEDPAEERSLDTFLKHLAPREAEVIRLRHVEGLNLREVGEVLGISASSAKTHYYRGLDKLRDLVRQRTEENE